MALHASAVRYRTRYRAPCDVRTSYNVRTKLVAGSERGIVPGTAPESYRNRTGIVPESYVEYGAPTPICDMGLYLSGFEFGRSVRW
jgi:hypothetical protein